MDFKEVCCNIRSCLNSSKSQLSLTQLLRDYNEVLGEPLPYRSLGYGSAESLIRAVPNLRISSIRGELFIDVKPDEKTAHIANLVREQKCAKKKKKKSSRGFYRGGAPPAPRRPATMPPPRRSAPPSRTSEYYPSRRRDSPPNSSYQRKPSPPRYSNRDNYYARRREPPPPYQNYRNSAPIEISSDEDNNCNNHNEQVRRYEDVIRKYRPVPSHLNFSDSNECNDFEGSDLEDCDEINSKMEELQVTLGKQRQVSINKPKNRPYPSNTSNEDDFGYSSMKTATINGAVDDRYLSRTYYQTTSSDSYEYDDEENDYTTTSSSATTGTNDKYSKISQNSSRNRRAFGHRNQTNVYDTDDYSTEIYSQNTSRGRGYPLKHYVGKDVQSDHNKTSENIRNIKVCLPNGSRRARVVHFLLR